MNEEVCEHCQDKNIIRWCYGDYCDFDYAFKICVDCMFIHMPEFMTATHHRPPLCGNCVDNRLSIKKKIQSLEKKDTSE